VKQRTIKPRNPEFTIKTVSSSPTSYFENEPGIDSAAKLRTRDEAWRIAANIAKLPGLVR
jgi:hypothetical protein